MLWGAVKQNFTRSHKSVLAATTPVVAVFGVMTAALSVRPTSTTMTESGSAKEPLSGNGVNSNHNQKRKTKSSGIREQHSYGSPFLSQDIYYDSKMRTALATLREMRRADVKEDGEGSKHLEGLKILDYSGRKDTGTLTLIGYKGGPLETQINQDRSMCIVPYHIEDSSKASSLQKSPRWSRQSTTAPPIRSRLIGVFDGHANLGERVSQYVVSELPKMLAEKLKGLDRTIDETKKALIETFIELDQNAPAEVSGGCTASVVLQDGPKVFFANAGDSRSFLVVFRENTATVEVVYITREDKPDLADERARVESRGGSVYLPLRGTSRVLYTDPVTGMQSGLAMSRSIGDWEVGKLGVIPDPIVDVVDIPELIESQLEKLSGDDIHIFAVSATDGMMDFVSPDAMGHAIALSMYGKDGPHLLTTLEQLIYISAQRWEQSKQGRYRDDIAIAVSEIRIPSDGKLKQ